MSFFAFFWCCNTSRGGSYLLLDPLEAVGVDLLGVCWEVAGADFSTAEPSPVISAMIPSRLFFSVTVRVTLVTAASSSASMSSSFSSSSMIWFFRCLGSTHWDGSSGPSSGSFSSSVGELSILDLAPSSSLGGSSDSSEIASPSLSAGSSYSA